MTNNIDKIKNKRVLPPEECWEAIKEEIEPKRNKKFLWIFLFGVFSFVISSILFFQVNFSVKKDFNTLSKEITNNKKNKNSIKSNIEENKTSYFSVNSIFINDSSEVRNEIMLKDKNRINSIENAFESNIEKTKISYSPDGINLKSEFSIRNRVASGDNKKINLTKKNAIEGENNKNSYEEMIIEKRIFRAATSLKKHDTLSFYDTSNFSHRNETSNLLQLEKLVVKKIDNLMSVDTLKKMTSKESDKIKPNFLTHFSFSFSVGNSVSKIKQSEIPIMKYFDRYNLFSNYIEGNLSYSINKYLQPSLGFGFSNFQKNVFSGIFLTEKGIYEHYIQEKIPPINEIYLKSEDCDCYFIKNTETAISGSLFHLSIGNTMKIFDFKRSELYTNIGIKHLLKNKLKIETNFSFFEQNQNEKVNVLVDRTNIFASFGYNYFLNERNSIFFQGSYHMPISKNETSSKISNYSLGLGYKINL